MKSPLWLGIIAFSTLALLISEIDAGPRDGGRRQPQRSTSGGFNRNSPSPASRPNTSNFNPGSRDLSSRSGESSRDLGNRDLGGRNLGSGDLSNRNLGDRNFSGQDKLSNTLEGKTFNRGDFGNGSPLSQDRLNDFLGLSGNDKDRSALNNRQPADNRQQQQDNRQQQGNDRQQQVNNHQQDWNNRQQQVNDHQQQLSDRQQNWNDRQQQFNDRQDGRQAQFDQTKQNVSQRSNEIYNNVSQQWANKPEPFTTSWYSQHPNTWQYAHPHADAWAAASFGALTGWVAGVASTPVSYSYNESNVYVAGDDSSNVSQQEQAQEAQQLSQASTPANSDEQWLPIGVYALVQGNETQSQMLMQISVSKSGLISGSYYNVLSDNSQPLSGSVDKKTQQVAWAVAGNQKAVFQTDLNSLTQQETPVVVRYDDGTSHQMTLVRLPENS
ncbi:hypothetical protein [Blastopirellula marina]|uniref:Mu-protocadherin-putative cell-suface protein n=1 Tax=Blastopirellula marina TaxID=124 RepID=A0A2S8G197_9BACT|nr:hypothetical protein [Blastopirellula marina]PQO38219.1 hypothetical protein C5Y98_09110 [Blastopirellula marina]PTL44875.1 hypothetical protein C5Y97_09115 [Blastopirellula marina]